MPRVICSLDCPRKPQRVHSAQGIAFIMTLAKLYGWEVNPARGCYRGQYENSFIIDGHGLVLAAPQFDVLQDLLAACGQETLVWVSARGHAQLVYNDGSEKAEQLGVWSELPEGSPYPESWTLDDVGRCWYCSGLPS